MARPLKQGLDYFPLDVDIDQNDKVAIIEAIHGIEGFGVLIKLMMKIYKEGYYYEWTKREQILFSKRVNVDINKVNEIVNECINESIFDKNMFKEHSVLTSKGIQMRFLEATKRRKNEELIKEFSLISVNLHENKKTSKQAKDGVNVNINEVNVDNNNSLVVINEDISTQSKVKESKVKKSKEKNIRESVNYEGIINYLNSKIGTNFQWNSDETLKFINGRIDEGYTMNDFKIVMDKKIKEWLGTDMQKHLNPSTLFRKSNFQKYLHQLESVSINKSTSNINQFERLLGGESDATKGCITVIQNDQYLLSE